MADCFIVKINPTGDTLYYSTLVGGSGYDCSLSIAVDSETNAIITGETHSQDFPTREALDNHLDGISDAFLLKLNASGNGIYYSTFLGGHEVKGGTLSLLTHKEIPMLLERHHPMIILLLMHMMIVSTEKMIASSLKLIHQVMLFSIHLM